MSLRKIINTLNQELAPLSFQIPVAYTYNPLEYARAPFDHYLKLYGSSPKQVVLVGMNPGPWGMAQTGIPFGEINHVRDWLQIKGKVTAPKKLHPKRPVLGFACERSEVSGRRLWGWARETFEAPEAFFQQFFVFNYCPLAFFDESGKNITPDKLKAQDRVSLFKACNQALRATVKHMSPQYVLGVGNFAEARVKEACLDLGVTAGRITHPSPANPKANRGWVPLIEKELAALGISWK